jgi:general stress protein YciG
MFSSFFEEMTEGETGGVSERECARERERKTEMGEKGGKDEHNYMKIHFSGCVWSLR